MSNPCYPCNPWLITVEMQEVTRKRAIALGLRAKVPVITRIVAFTLLVSGLLVVGISYYKLRNTSKFKVASGDPELSKEVTGVMEGYERRITKNDRLWLLLKASRDITFCLWLLLKASRDITF